MVRAATTPAADERKGFWAELNRRHVLSISGAYIAIAWLVTEIAGFMLEQASAPGWILRVLAIAFVVGFPVTAIIAWVVQVKPGDKWTLDSSKGQGKTVTAALLAGIAFTAGLSWLIIPRIEDPPEYPDYNPLPYSVAIMPFLDPGMTPNEVTIGETLYIALSNGLNASHSLTQVNLKLKEAPTDPASLGRRVRVVALLAGQVLRSAGRTQVEMSLLEIPSGKPRWTRRFDWDATQIMEQGTEIANGVLQSLNLPVITRDRFAGTDNREAYDAFLMGRRLAWTRFLEPDIQQAIPHFERAIELDPSFLTAHVALANAWQFLSSTFVGSHQEREQLQERFEHARDAAQRLDPDSPDVLVLLGSSAALGPSMEPGDREMSIQAYQRALEIDPDNLGALQRYGWLLWTNPRDRSDHVKAAKLFRKLVESYPLSANEHQNLALVLYDLGREEEAREEMLRSIELEPALTSSYGWLGRWEANRGRYDRSIEYFSKNHEYEDAGFWLAEMYAVLGAEEQALAWLGGDSGVQRMLQPDHQFWALWVANRIFALMGREDWAYQVVERLPECARYDLLRDTRPEVADLAVQNYQDCNPWLVDPDAMATVTDDPDKVFNLIQYAWLLKNAGEEAQARQLARQGLDFFQGFCSKNQSVEEQFWLCADGLGWEAYALLQDREATLAELRRMIVQEHYRYPVYRDLKTQRRLGFLQEDSEYQRLMKIIEDDLAAQLDNVRELERNDELPLPPREETIR